MNTVGKTERLSVGVLESHTPTQARTTSRHPPPDEKETQGVPGRAATHPAPEMITVLLVVGIVLVVEGKPP